MNAHHPRCRGQAGYAMAALLVALSVMGIVMSVALPVWRTAVQREREDELIFRGEQYARAVELFQRKYGGTFPPNIDVLLKERMLRQKYKDPMTENGEFQILYVGQVGTLPGQTGPGAGGRGMQPARGGGPVPATTTPPTQAGRAGGLGPNAQGGVVGVASKSTAASLRLYNGRGRYNEWTFMATQMSNRGGTGGQAPARGRGPGTGPGPSGGGMQPPGRRGPNQPPAPGRGPGRGLFPPGL